MEMKMNYCEEIKKGFCRKRVSFEVFLNDETFRENVGKCFKTEPAGLLKNLAGIWKYAKYDPDLENSFYERHNCRYIHNAMNIVRDALDTEMPSVGASVEAVVSKEQLGVIVGYLENDNLPGAIFTIAPISRALFDGAYHKYIKGKGNKTVFFNLKSDYNLMQLEKRVNATKRHSVSF